MSIKSAQLDKEAMRAQDIVAEETREVATANDQLENVVLAEQTEQVARDAEEKAEDKSLDGVDADMSVKVVLGSIIEAGKKIGLATGLLVKNEATPEPDDVEMGKSANTALTAVGTVAPVAGVAVAAARSFAQHFDDIKGDLQGALPENVQNEIKNIAAPLNDFANADFAISQADGLEVATQGIDPNIALGQDAGLNA